MRDDTSKGADYKCHLRLMKLRVVFDMAKGTC